MYLYGNSTSEFENGIKKSVILLCFEKGCMMMHYKLQCVWKFEELCCEKMELADQNQYMVSPRLGTICHGWGL